MALRRVVVLAAVAALCGACAPSPVPARTAVPTVVEVLDGDTVVVRLGEVDETVRLLGVDTPETHHPAKPVECFGAEASAFTAALLPPGTEVALTTDREPRDAYGRLLAYVRRVDLGRDVNLELVAGGYAVVLVIAPNTARADELRVAEARARAAGAGLWGECGGPGVPAV